MSRAAILLAAIGGAAAATFPAAARSSPAAQGPLAFRESTDHPAIKYSTTVPTDAVSVLNRRMESGAVRLALDPIKGYLPSVLQALEPEPPRPGFAVVA